MTPLSQDYRTIRLTNGMLALVDEFNFEWLSQWQWTASWIKTSNTYYA